MICDGEFIHTNGPISIGATALTLNGSVTFPASAGNGSMTGSATSSLNIGGSGAITHSLFMSQSGNAAHTLGSFMFNRALETIVLGTPLIVTTFEHVNGNIDLGGTSLTLNGDVTFPAGMSNGSFIGSTTSSLTIGLSAALVTNPLLLSQTNAGTRTLSFFSINRIAQTLTLGSNLIIADRFTQTNGIIDLNGKSLSVGGTIAFPALITNGYLIGSPASTLCITGTGAISNSLKLDQATTSGRTINTFSLNHTGGTLVLGTDVVCNGPFVHTTGTITLGSTLLTLNGAVTFPLAATDGSMTGSASASVIIAGSGTIANALFLSQANAAARTLGNFSFDRAGETLALGNPIIVNTFDHISGIMDLAGTSLTLNGPVTFPTNILNGSFAGSLTSSLSIGTSTNSITNQLLFSQANAGSKSLSLFTLNRTGETLTLGNDLIVSDGFTQTNGTIDLGGKSLSIGGTIVFPSNIANGSLIGSLTSSLSITGNGAVSNSLKLDQGSQANRTIDFFNLDHTGGTITLGNNLVCNGEFIHTNGTLAIGGTSLSLNGAIVFPASSSNGLVTGSTTSSVSIAGSGSITNSLFMNQVNAAARTFNNLVIDRAGATVGLGDPLIINSFTQTNGSINLNGTSLTLNAAITFPASFSNGAFIGSVTSSVTIAGSGAIVNPLRMDQSNASNLSLYDLTMNRTGQTLNIGNELEIRNSMVPTRGTIATGGFVKLKADATRSAMVGVVGGSIAGNLSVETFAPGGFTGWTHLGPSGVNGLTVANWEGQIIMTCSGCPNDEYSAGGYFVSIQGYNEGGAGDAAYIPLSYSSSLTRGLGYWVYMGTGSLTTAAVTYSVSGPAVSGNVALPLTVSANSGFNLLSNPYPSPIDWDLVAGDAANANITGAAYFYNPDLGQSISYVGGVSNPSGYIANGVIPMGQGFYVQASAAGNITFRETHKSIQNTSANPLLKPQQTNTVGDLFRLSVLGPYGDYDETAIRFHPDATSDFDRLLDARKLFQTPGFVGTSPTYSRYTTISSRTGNEDYAINSLPANETGELVLPLLVKAQITGTFIISPLDIQHLNANSCLILNDKLLNYQHDLQTGAYTCHISDTTSTPRFELIFCANPVLGIPASGELNHVVIGQNNGSVIVSTSYNCSTKSVISVYNYLGQKIIADTETEGKENFVKLNVDGNSRQMVVVRVTSDKAQVTRKLYIE
jgi:hypothetical protein